MVEIDKQYYPPLWRVIVLLLSTIIPFFLFYRNKKGG